LIFSPAICTTSRIRNHQRGQRNQWLERQEPTPIIVNRAFANSFFPNTDPIGKAIVRGIDGSKPPMAIIVGLVGTAKYRSLREQNPPAAGLVLLLCSAIAGAFPSWRAVKTDANIALRQE
jgi:hypothetical protein